MTKMEYKEIPVVLLTSDTYVIPTAVAIQSLIDHYSFQYPLHIFVVHTGIGSKLGAKLKQFERNQVEVTLIETDNKELSKYNVEGYYVTYVSLLKFKIPGLLPQYDKILYIDGDILVRKDITPLYKYDITHYYAGVIADMAGTETYGFHHRLKLTRYFNAGVFC